MARIWVNFAELRAKLNFETVLRHYKVEIKRKGVQHQGCCPLPGHTGRRSAPSFSANLERGIFQCFLCHAKGNTLDFATLMENGNPANGEEIRAVAVKLQQLFVPEGSGRRNKEAVSTGIPAPRVTPTIVNAPLDFALQGLDPSHPYLSEWGFTNETAKFFGLGYCARGSLAGRIAIPLHAGVEGKLVGYAGRLVDDTAISEENPAYLFPSTRERNGTIYKFDRSLFLYNGSRLRPTQEPLIVVMGIPSVWWLAQNGFARVVATMGAECSEEQAKLIEALVLPAGQVWVMPDGGEAGKRFAQMLLLAMAPHRLVRWVRLEEGQQPTDLEERQLNICFTV